MEQSELMNDIKKIRPLVCDEKTMSLIPSGVSSALDLAHEIQIKLVGKKNHFAAGELNSVKVVLSRMKVGFVTKPDFISELEKLNRYLISAANSLQ